MQERQHRVFVYGTLRFGFGLHRAIRDCPYLGERSLAGFEMADVGAFPAIHRTGAPDQYVIGEVYRVDDHELYILDSVEGYTEGRRNNHYERIAVEIDGLGECWVYTYTDDSWDHLLERRGSGVVVESGDYVRHCIEFREPDPEVVNRKLGERRLARDLQKGVSS